MTESYSTVSSQSALDNRLAMLYTSLMTNLLNQITQKKKKLDQFKPFPKALIKNLNDWFRVELTYTSNAIEGNTLTKKETAQIVEKGLTVEGKSLTEHLEAVNHAEALDFITKFAVKKDQKITQKNILHLHQLILQKIDNQNAGRYRTINVRIAGVNVIFPNSAKIPGLMKDFTNWLAQKNQDHPAKKAADAHFKLVSIHPFVDGNGRTARLLMNLILLQNGYPSAVIETKERSKYINAIEKGHPRLIYKAIDRSLDIYLSALNQKQESQTIKKDLLKIGELAKKTNESIHTIRFWTKMGLLEVEDYTKGGYQLFSSSMIQKAKKIRNLQRKKRLTLNEIKKYKA